MTTGSGDTEKDQGDDCTSDSDMTPLLCGDADCLGKFNCTCKSWESEEMTEYRIVQVGDIFYPERRSFKIWRRMPGMKSDGVTTISSKKETGAFNLEDARKLLADHCARKVKVIYLAS